MAIIGATKATYAPKLQLCNRFCQLFRIQLVSMRVGLLWKC